MYILVHFSSVKTENYTLLWMEKAKAKVKEEFAKEFGVDSDALMDDKGITSPDEMKLKARELSLDSREANTTGTERFDSGQRGATSSDLDNMSALEKVRSGLSNRRRG